MESGRQEGGWEQERRSLLWSQLGPPAVEWSVQRGEDRGGPSSQDLGPASHSPVPPALAEGAG